MTYYVTIMMAWKPTCLLLSFACFVDGDGKKDGCLASRESGMEACISLAGNISRRELMRITLSDIGSVCSIAGLVFAFIAFAYTNRKRK